MKVIDWIFGRRYLEWDEYKERMGLHEQKLPEDQRQRKQLSISQ